MNHSTPQPSSSFKLYRRLLEYVKEFSGALGIAILCDIIFSGVDAGFTYLLKPVLNEGFIAKDMHFIRWLPLLVVAAFLVRGITHSAGLYFMARVSRGIVMRLRQKIFRHLLRLPASYYDQHSSGQILSTIVYNVEQVADAGANAITDFVQSGCLIIGLLVVMFSISWKMSLFYFLAVPLIGIAAQWSTKRLRKISRSIQSQMGDVTCIAEEMVEGYRAIRSFGGEDYEAQKFDHAAQVNWFRELKLVVTKAVSVSGIQLIAGIALSITIYLTTAHPGTMLSAGSFVALVAAMLAILKPLKTFVTVNATIQKGLAGAQSIFELLNEPTEQDTGTRSLARLQGEVAFAHVCFSYPRTDKLVLHDIHFSISQGKTLALVGHSGGGKTTLMSVLQRFYDPTQGTIYLDGIDSRDILLMDLRRQFAVVPQQVTLFNDTVEKNIAYGRFEKTSEAEIIAAAKAANAWNFIQEMPQGLKTVIGENGVLLSGGQRQRLAIARALLKDAPILILDEATSALDTESEREIQGALKNLMQGRTVFVIAHRLSTIENADLIIVLDHGKIVEMGSHQELLLAKKYYAKLHQLQFKEEE